MPPLAQYWTGTTAGLNDLIRRRNDIAHFHPLVQTMYDEPTTRSDEPTTQSDEPRTRSDEQDEPAPRTAAQLVACDALITTIRERIETEYDPGN